MTSLSRLIPRRSLTLRIILVNLTLIVLALGGFVLWSGWRLQQSMVEDAEAELEVRALIVANGLREPVQQQIAFEEEHETGAEKEDQEDGHITSFVPIGDRDFKALVDSYAREMQARVMILDPSLHVLYASDPHIPIHASDAHPELIAALQQKENHDIRFDEWSGQRRLFVAAPILGKQNVEGVVQLSIPLDEIQTRVRAMWLTFFSAGLALVILSLLASIILGRQITRPLKRLTAAAHRLAAGDLSIRLEMNRDDEVGELAAAFDHMADEITHLLARERAFVANASHELRSPITSIQLRAELLERTRDAERRDRYLREIHQEADNLGRLLQQLLDLDRAQQGKPSQSTYVDLVPCIQKVTTLMEPLAQEAGLRMITELPAQLPPVRIDEGSCEIILRNLLDNAIKYTPAGGEVRVQARVVDQAVELVVADTGVGVPEKDLPHIFDRFYRVDKARNRRGAGLGLALVRELVHQHGGDVRAHASPGKGLTMVLRFPIPPTHS